jgi:Zn finger protein HypA/HybF involved in hydrogenase expression
MDVELADQIRGKSCICKDCDNKFKSIGNRIRCPSCGSDSIVENE